MSLARRLRIALKALSELGPGQVGLFALYQLGLRSGYFRWATSHPERWYFARNKLASPAPELLDTSLFPLPSREDIFAVIGEAGLQALRSEADEIVNGKARFFGGELVPLNLARDVPKVHWTEYELGRVEIGRLDKDIKFIWEPGRFGWACTLARAYYLTGEERFAEAFWLHYESFMQANPPFLGPQWISGQEVALRLIILIFVIQIFAPAVVSSPNRLEGLADMVAAHAGRIPPTLLYARAQNNNHLLVEGAALYTAGLALPAHPQARRWQRLGWHWLHHALQTQIGVDGAYVQHSTNYHRLMLQTALWTKRLALAQRQSLPQITNDRLVAATAWLWELGDPFSGHVPNLGPNDGAYILPLTIYPFHDFRPVLQAATQAFWGATKLPQGAWNEMVLWLSGPRSDVIQAEGKNSSLQQGPDSVIRLPGSKSWGYLRSARFNSRPGHADQLHFDLWWRGINVAQDPGSYLYNAPPPWDNALSCAAVHNTLMVNGREQMTRAGRFLWLDWAQGEVLERAQAEDRSWQKVTARHDGYRTLGIEHRRSATAYGEREWVVKDQLLQAVGVQPSEKPVTAQLHWLLPDWEWAVASEDEVSYTLRLHSPYGWIELGMQAISKENGLLSNPQMQIARAGKLLFGPSPASPVSGWIAPTYGTKLPALSVSFMVETALPTELASRWVFPAVDPGIPKKPD